MSPELRDSIHAEKERLRRQFRLYRQSLTDPAYMRLSDAVIERLTSLPEVCRAQTVHVYWPMVERREIDTRPLIGWLETHEIEIVLPLVVNFEIGKGPEMVHVRYPGAEQLRRNRWGIAEPRHGERVKVETLDAIVVPALGAGRNGHRIGHGRGYYDAFLARVGVPRICPVYDSCLVDVVPSEPHDVMMDVLVTEHEVVRPGAE